MNKRSAYFVEEIFIAKLLTIKDGISEMSLDRKVVYTVWEPKDNSGKFGRLKSYLRNDVVPRYMIFPDKIEVKLLEENMTGDGVYITNTESVINEMDEYYLNKGVLFEGDMQYFYNKINGVIEYDNCVRYIKKKNEG